MFENANQTHIRLCVNGRIGADPHTKSISFCKIGILDFLDANQLPKNFIVLRLEIKSLSFLCKETGVTLYPITYKKSKIYLQ